MKHWILRIVVAGALVSTALLCGFVQAQGFPGGRGQDRGPSHRNQGNADVADAMKRRGAATTSGVSEPTLALERELPSLRADLLLDKTQLDAWAGFERSVKDAAQGARGRQRRVIDQRQDTALGGVDLAPGAAFNFLQELIDDERSRADSLAGVGQALGALIKTLDSRQTAMINRRVVQAIRDPLGTS